MKLIYTSLILIVINSFSTSSTKASDERILSARVSNERLQGCCGQAFLNAQKLLGRYKVIDYYNNLENIETVYAVIDIKKIIIAPTSGNYIEFSYDIYYYEFSDDNLQAQDLSGRVYANQTIIFHQPQIDTQTTYAAPMKFKGNTVKFGTGSKNLTYTVLECDLVNYALDSTHKYLYYTTCGANAPEEVASNVYIPIVIKEI